jgi:carboxypeptidase Taq
MEDKLTRLKDILSEIYDLNMTQAVLGWDQQTYMPVGGAEDRGNQLGLLARLTHQKLISEEVESLLENLSPLAAQLPEDSNDACLIRVANRDYQKNSKVPSSWVETYARETTVAQSAWEQAKASSNFAQFRPHLECIVDLRRQYASFFAPYDHVYDPMLDDFEPGLKTAEVQTIFNVLRPQQVALIQAIQDCSQVDNTFLYQNFPAQPQWDFGVEMITRFGFDWKRGRQDRSVHPFTTSFGQGDVRITTRVEPDYVASALFSTVHETGHALYEQGLDAALHRSPLSNGASMAVHESQSRLWENLVGRSKPFWKFAYPRLQEHFPTQLGNVPMEAFYRAVNKVTPSLIRVEADEATYNLHIMLRLELEIALMEGSLQVVDLPDAWNERMREFFGLVPPDDAHGVLQDVHWSSGLFGYFPTYALGNLISAQLWECIQSDIPDLDEQVEHGKFDALLGWLREKIHRHGAKFEPQVLVERVTGSRIDPQPYIRYLNNKYTEIYGLKK